jgi:hypothetical protein
MPTRRASSNLDSIPTTGSSSGEPVFFRFGILSSEEDLAMSIRRIVLIALLIAIVGCGPGYEKGVNKDLDKPMPADKADKADKK